MYAKRISSKDPITQLTWIRKLNHIHRSCSHRTSTSTLVLTLGRDALYFNRNIQTKHQHQHQHYRQKSNGSEPIQKRKRWRLACAQLNCPFKNHDSWSLLVTARKRSLRRLCFYTCLSFCPRGGGGFYAQTQGGGWGSGQGCPSPHPGDSGWWWMSRPTIRGGVQAQAWGVCPGPGPGGCIPACTEADTVPPPPNRWLMLLAVRILLECILVQSVILLNLSTLGKLKPVKLMKNNCSLLQENFVNIAIQNRKFFYRKKLFVMTWCSFIVRTSVKRDLAYLVTYACYNCHDKSSSLFREEFWCVNRAVIIRKRINT